MQIHNFTSDLFFLLPQKSGNIIRIFVFFEIVLTTYIQKLAQRIQWRKVHMNMSIKRSYFGVASQLENAIGELQLQSSVQIVSELFLKFLNNSWQCKNKSPVRYIRNSHSWTTHFQWQSRVIYQHTLCT